MEAGVAPGRESEYVSHSKENKELSRALDLPGFNCAHYFSKNYRKFKFSNIRK